MPASADVAPVFLPPGGPMEVMFSFDTTGSMSGCIAEVKTRVEETIRRLFADIPGLRIAVMAHGDYCDASNYVTKYVDFTNDVNGLTNFVQKVSSTGGGDWEECYELVLHQARTVLGWSPGTQRALVMIGDAIPHGTKYAQNKGKIDWKKETKALWEEMGVRIYAVQCQKNQRADFFYEHLAKATDGKWIQLADFQNVIDMLMAICYREQGPDMFMAYEKEVRAREGKTISRNLDTMFKSLRKPGDDDDDDAMDTDDVAPAKTPTPAVRATARKTLKAKRGGAAAKKVTVARPPTPIRATRGRKRSATPTARPMKRAKAGDDAAAKAGPSRKAAPTVRPRRRAHLMKLRPRPRTTPHAAARKHVKTAATRARKSVEAARKNREAVPQTDLNLSGILTWSPWREAVVPTTPGKSDSWIPRKNYHPGYRNTDAFQHDTKKPAVYEFAVQTPEGRKYPVLSRTSAGFNGRHWDTKLLSSTPVESQLDRVVKRGCKLFARRALFTAPASRSGGSGVSSLDELRSLLHQTYDYPWQEHYDSASRRYLHRTVMRDGVLISDNTRA